MKKNLPQMVKSLPQMIKNAGDFDLIPGLGRSLEEGNGYPLQVSGLENSTDCIVHGAAKSRTQLTFTFKHKTSPGRA